MILLLLFSLILTGCASSFESRYPDECVMTKPDDKGTGFTSGIWPCRLKHVATEEKKP